MIKLYLAITFIYFKGHVTYDTLMCLLQESVEWEHNSKVPWNMHGCGHDAHVAMLLGSAKILQEHRDKLKVSKEALSEL